LLGFVLTVIVLVTQPEKRKRTIMRLKKRRDFID